MRRPTLSLQIEPHPKLDVRVFVSDFPGPLESLTVPDEISRLLLPEAKAPLSADDSVRGAVRDLLREGGYKPTGRGKPASEYLVRAVAEGRLGSINLAVDLANAVSLHSGLPISVVDLDRAGPPLSIRLGRPGEAYVFNASGQTLELEGLLCLCDAEGPCANAVKDAQRTKTHGGTSATLTVLWGTKALGGRSEAAYAWYRERLEAAGVTVTPVSETSA